MQLNVAGFTDVVSPLDLVQRIVATGNFVAAPTEEPGPGEVQIGELTIEEKAILSARRYGSMMAMKSARSVSDELLQKGDSESPGDEMDRFELFVDWMETLNQLLWTTLKTRFLEQLITAKSKDIGIRSNFRVVVLTGGRRSRLGV